MGTVGKANKQEAGKDLNNDTICCHITIVLTSKTCRNL